jgi:hypothetical protein
LIAGIVFQNRRFKVHNEVFMTDNPTNTPVNTEKQGLALDAVLSQAATIGIDEAIKKFGESLTPTERELVKTLTPEEIKSLNAAKAKLGVLGIRPLGNNNNHNYG